MASDKQPNRLATGGRIDRAQPRAFQFDGKSFSGFAGDTLASALIANDRHLVGRSFKYHRPRGILTAGSEEPSALVELRSGARREPNTRATTIEVFDGLAATSQNRWPSLNFDVLAINQWAAPLLSAGFYYKTFMWPAAFWEKLYEPLIRRAAGLGRAANAEDPDTYEKSFAHCDVLVIGSGPAGLMAALAAGRTGARVILADEDFELGGRLLSERHDIAGMAGADWVTVAAAELTGLPNVRIMQRTTVFGVYDGGTYGALERVSDHVAVPPAHAPRQRSWRIFAKRAILAAGAIERPLVFGGNDKPGIMLAGAARTYLNRFAATPGRNLAVFTCCDDGWRTAQDAITAGIHVEAVIDSRADVARTLAEPLVGSGTRTFFGARVIRTHGVFGPGNLINVDRLHRVSGVDLLDANSREIELDCDALLMSGGWSPTINLTCHLGAKPRWQEAIAAFVPDRLPPGMVVAGASNGDLTLARCLAAGVAAGRAASADLGFSARAQTVPRADDEPSGITPLWHAGGSKGLAFVDFQNDVTTKDIQLAEREGYRSVELAKRYTTLGMATER